MKIEIKHYCEEYINQIVEIINYNILNTSNIYEIENRSYLQQHDLFSNKIQKNYPVLVAVSNNEVLGFGYFNEFRTLQANKYTVEHSIYVDKKYQNLGIGKLILTELIKIAKHQKMHTMIAVIDSQNSKSIKFHQNFGFISIGTIKDIAFKFDKWHSVELMQLML
jgi:L-amino acid N-acyltransferase YncA